MPRAYTQTIILGESERLRKEFRDASGNLVTATNVKVSVYDPNGVVVVDNASATEESTGVFYYTLTISSAASTPEGLYPSFFKGSIGGVNLTQDRPSMLLVRRFPYITQESGELIDSVRRLVGDSDPSNYKISDVDILSYIQDGIRLIQLDYNMSYTVTATYSGITFNKTLTQQAKELFIQGAVLSILKHIRARGLWSVGSLDVGDLRINMTNINRERALAVKELQDKIERSIKQLKMGFITGNSIDTYRTGDLTISGLL